MSSLRDQIEWSEWLRTYNLRREAAMTVSAPINRSWWGKVKTLFAGLGGIVASGRQEERLADKKYEATKRTLKYRIPGDPNWHEHTGTPAQWRRFKADHPEWFPK